ncbi:hypothetical protein [Methylobacterium oryzae]|uniref:4Fe-4S ferredoxin-type domain-containing protein n=1 Tax=Methylobacterium oryzae TaxID=334852 RepID=A0ABU7TQZ5_9HYPH
MATIILLDETRCRRMIAKPREGQPCTGCGYCCAESACGLAREYVAGVGAKHDGPCPALEFEDGRFWCGLVRHAGRYMDFPEDWADTMLGGLFAQVLGAGQGCDASDP